MEEKIDPDFLKRVLNILCNPFYGIPDYEVMAQYTYYCAKYNLFSNLNNAPNISPKNRLFNMLNCVTGEQQYKIIDELCSNKCLHNKDDIKDLRDYLHKQYGNFSPKISQKNPLVYNVRYWLEKYPKSYEQYEKALQKYDDNIFERNTLDDMRLSFELLVKYLLKNEKSLENQISEIGSKLKELGASVELRNMVQQVIKYYTDFQNNHVKHNDVVNKNEIEYIIELTSVVMKFLIKITEGANQQ